MRKRKATMSPVRKTAAPGVRAAAVGALGASPSCVTPRTGYRLRFDLAMEQSLDREMRIDARDHLFRLDGLRDEIHRARFEPANAVLRVVERGHEDHGSVAGLRIGFEAAACLIAVDARHDDIEQDDQGSGARCDPQRLLTTAGDEQAVVRTGERFAQDVQIRGFVIDQENPARVTPQRLV